MSFNSPGGGRDGGFQGPSNMNQRNEMKGPGPLGGPGPAGGDRGRSGPPVKNYSTGAEQRNSMGPGDRGSLLGDNPMRGPIGGPPSGMGAMGNPPGPMGGAFGSLGGPTGLMGGPPGGPGGPLGAPFGGPPPGGSILGPPVGGGLLGGPLGLPGMPGPGLLGPLGGPALPLVGLTGPLAPQINPPINGVPMGPPLGGQMGGPMGAPIFPMGSQAGPMMGQSGMMGAAAGPMVGAQGGQLGGAGGGKEMTPPIGEIPSKLFEWAGSVVKMQPLLRCGILRLTGVNQVGLFDNGISYNKLTSQATFYCFFTDTSCSGPVNVGTRVVANARLVQAGWKVDAFVVIFSSFKCGSHRFHSLLLL